MASIPVWQAKGTDAVQLFRDFFFGRFGDTTACLDIYEDRERSYRFYNKNAFYRHVKKCKEQVSTYKKFKTGLGDPVFKRAVRLNEPPNDQEKVSIVYEEPEKVSEKSPKRVKLIVLCSFVNAGFQKNLFWSEKRINASDWAIIFKLNTRLMKRIVKVFISI